MQGRGTNCGEFYVGGRSKRRPYEGNGKGERGGKCEDVARIVVSFTLAGGASGAPTNSEAGNYPLARFYIGGRSEPRPYDGKRKCRSLTLKAGSG